MNNTYYFSHDANASTDTKILKLRKKYGLAGYGLFWLVLEKLRQNEEYKIEFCDDEIEALEILSMSEISIREFLEYCIKIKLFVIDKNNFLYSESLNRRMNKYEEIIEKKRSAGKKGAEKRWQKDSSAIAPDSTPMAPDSTGIAKNSKLNKTKLNEIKLNETNNNIELVEVEDFVQKNNLNINAKEFYDYYDSRNWTTVDGIGIYNWQNLLLLWAENPKAIKKIEEKNERQTDYSQFENIDINGEFKGGLN